MNQVEKGHYYEQIAADYLEQQGYKIVERNYRYHRAEIDIIAFDDSVLVFVEVKYRKNARVQHPAEAVTFNKQKQISIAASGYVYQHDYDNQPCRFDVIAISDNDVTLYKNAFFYQDKGGF